MIKLQYIYCWEIVESKICWNHLVYVRILFSVTSCIETFNCIYTCDKCTDYLYAPIQCLFVELNSYELMVFIAERRLSTISHSVPYISPLVLIWSIWNKSILMIQLYMVSTCIYLYYHSFYGSCGVGIVTQIVFRSVLHCHPVCVPIRS